MWVRGVWGCRGRSLGIRDEEVVSHGLQTFVQWEDKEVDRLVKQETEEAVRR